MITCLSSLPPSCQVLYPHPLPHGRSFIIAGRDTTAVTLSWTFFVLLQESHILKTLLAEIESALGGKAPTYDSMRNLPFLDAVINEVLRLYPPVPIDPKEAVEDDYLPDGTFVPAGHTVAYDVFAMGRSADLWPDPLKVQPERWIGKSKPSQYHFPVFQAGPRICLGMNMAYFEAKLLTIMTLQNFTFEMVSDPSKVTYVPTVTLNMTEMQVKVASR
jgi:cytochrome P450